MEGNWISDRLAVQNLDMNIVKIPQCFLASMNLFRMGMSIHLITMRGTVICRTEIELSKRFMITRSETTLWFLETHMPIGLVILSGLVSMPTTQKPGKEVLGWSLLGQPSQAHVLMATTLPSKLPTTKVTIS